MTAISSISSAAATPTTTPATVVNPVAQSSQSGLSQTAVKLSSDSSIVATLGGSSSTTPLYNAVGLLNSITQAGSAASTTPASTSTTTPSSTQAAQASQDSAVLSSISPSSSSSSSTSGIYSAAGTLQNASSTNANSNWASLLQSTPTLASTLASDTSNQAIVASLSVTA